MGRSLSWLNRLFPIARAVAGSARSHYDRKDLQQLFEIQSRSAQYLMTLMPIVQIGNIHLVEREVLSAFLQRLVDAENPAEEFTSLRSKGHRPVRRRLKTLSLQEVSADLDKPPVHLTLQPGEIKVRFQTVEELAETMVYLAAVLQNDLETFVARYEPAPVLEEGEQQEEERRRADAAYVDNWKDKGLQYDSRTVIL